MANHWEIMHRVVVSESPEDLWNNATKYFRWCEDNPIMTKKTIMNGKGAGDKVFVQYVRPYSIKALCLHCGILEEWLRDVRANKDKSSLWYQVVSKILYIIYIQNLEMATIGEFNPIFTAKVLNLEKDDTPTGSVRVELVSGLPELSKSENEILEKLELENAKRETPKEQFP